MFGGHAPKAPSFMPLPPVTQPAPFVAPSDAQTTIPKVFNPQQIMQQGAKVESMLPVGLQMGQYYGSPTGAPGSPGGYGPYSPQLMQQTENWYMRNMVQPQVAAMESQGQSNGQNYGSFAPAMMGQMTAQGQEQAFQAALQANQQQYQDFLAGRNAYMGVGPALSQQQNAANVQRGEAVQGFNVDAAQMQNQYNLADANMLNQYNLAYGMAPNNFNLQRYGDQIQGYQAQNQLGLGLLGAGNNLLGTMFSGATGIGNMGANLMNANTNQMNSLGSFMNNPLLI